MKRLIIIFFALCVIMVTGSAKTLVAYYSYTGDCESIVTELAKQISADVLEIEPAEKGLKYEADGYALGTALLNAIKANPGEAASYPAIDPAGVYVADYSTVIIVTPLWWSQMSAIMQSYLFQVGKELAGKQVGLVVSSASSGISGVVADFKRLVPDAEYISENLWINNSNRSNMPTLVADWVENNKLNMQKTEDMKINVKVGNKTFAATLADNETGRAFAALLPLTVTMSELNGNEKYYYLDSSLPTDSYKPGTIHEGDILLYGNNCVVLFYETFSSGYSYTRIGAIDDPAGLADAVGTGNVEVSFSADKSDITGVELIAGGHNLGVSKVIRDGKLYIISGNTTYNANGARVK